MIGKNTIKLIKSLALKKYRTKEKLFLVEGDKLVSEVINSQLIISQLLVTLQFSENYEIDLKNIENILEVDSATLKKASLLQNPQNSIAICRLPKKRELPPKLNNSLSVFLDGIQDPGNLGTIIRICDWFGINSIFASPDTVDLYNPKVIQASMGSFNRIAFYECSFNTIHKIAKESSTPIFGAFMDGANIYTETLPQNTLLVMGNEGKGIRKDVEELIDRRISIPNLSTNASKAESLNVSVATAIICSEFKRAL